MKTNRPVTRSAGLYDGLARLRGRYSHLELSDRTKSLLCLAGLALLPFLLFWDVTTLRQIPFVGDTTDYYYPNQYYLSQQLKQGNFSLWNDRLLSGVPLTAPAGTFYPLNWLFAPIPAWMALSYSLLLHFSLAGVFAFICARGFGMRRRGAVVTGVVFMLSGFFVAHLYSANIVSTVPWLPLILWATEQWRQKLQFRYIGVGALATGLMFLAGHPQIPLFSVSIVVIYLLFAVILDTGSGQRLRILLGAGVMFGLSLLVASPLIWDLYETSQTYAGAAPGTYEYCTTMSLAPGLLPHMIFPYLFSHSRDFVMVEMSGYVGIMAFPLAVLGVRYWNHKIRFFLLFLAAVSVLLVLGKYTPLYDLMCRVPIYNAFRVPARNWFEFDFALAMLAGAGVSSLAGERAAAMGQPSRRTRQLAIILIAATALLAAVTIWAFTHGPEQLLAGIDISSWTHPAVWLPLLMLLLSAGALFILAARPFRWTTALLIIGLIVGDLYFSFAIHAFALNSTRMPPSTAFADMFDEPLDSVRFLQQNPDPYRVIPYSTTFKTDLTEKYALLLPNLNVLFDIASADGYKGDRIPERYAAFTDRAITGSANATFTAPRLFDTDHNTILSALNVKYVLVPVRHALLYSSGLVVEGIRFDDWPFHFGTLLGESGLTTTTLEVPDHPATSLAIASYLIGGQTLSDDQPILRVSVTDQDGQTLTRYLTAGVHTAESTYDCLAEEPSHERAPIAYDLPGEAPCASHAYFAHLDLGQEPLNIQRIGLEYLPEAGNLQVDKVSLYNEKNQASYPVSVAQGNLALLSEGKDYHQVYEDEYVRIYENKNALPRTYLVPQVAYVSSPETADRTVRQGAFPDGSPYVPREVALIEAPISEALPDGGTISLQAYPIEPAFWTVVQWQDAEGGWRDVEGWQAPFDEQYQVAWGIAPDDFGKGPFRWAIHERQGGALVAATDPFHLPASAEEAVRIQVPLLWPHTGQANSAEGMDHRLQATLTVAQPGHMEVQTLSDRNAFLVYSENHFPGWRAALDGQPVGLYRTNGTLMGVPVPAGEHTVVFDYRPATLYLAVLSCFVMTSITVVLAFVAVRQVRRKRQRP